MAAGLNHYTVRKKSRRWRPGSRLRWLLDWIRPPRLQNGPSFHYVHSDQWHYESSHTDYHPPEGRFWQQHFMDLQAEAVRMGWLPFYPQFNRNPIHLVRDAEQAGAQMPTEISQWMADQLRTGKTRFAVDDPRLPENWPRVWLIWRATRW